MAEICWGCGPEGCGPEGCGLERWSLKGWGFRMKAERCQGGRDWGEWLYGGGVASGACLWVGFVALWVELGGCGWVCGSVGGATEYGWGL